MVGLSRWRAGADHGKLGSCIPDRFYRSEQPGGLLPGQDRWEDQGSSCTPLLMLGGSPQGSEKFEHNMAEFPKIRVKLLYAKVRNSMPPAAPKMLPIMILCKLNSYDDKAKEHIR